MCPFGHLPPNIACFLRCCRQTLRPQSSSRDSYTQRDMESKAQRGLWSHLAVIVSALSSQSDCTAASKTQVPFALGEGSIL